MATFREALSAFAQTYHTNQAETLLRDDRKDAEI